MFGWSWCKSIKKRQRISVRTETGALPGSNWFKSTTWPLIYPSEGNHPNWQNSCHQSNVVWLNYSHFSLLHQLAFKQKIAFDETRNHKILFLFSMEHRQKLWAGDSALHLVGLACSCRVQLPRHHESQDGNEGLNAKSRFWYSVVVITIAITIAVSLLLPDHTHQTVLLWHQKKA